MNRETRPHPAVRHFQFKTDHLPDPVYAIRYFLALQSCRPDRSGGHYFYCCYTYPAKEIFPVGYCVQNCSGHSSSTEAREHYRQYLLDHHGRYDGVLSSRAACVLCGNSTRQYATVDYHYEWEAVPLCYSHLHRDGLNSAFVLKDYHLLQWSNASLEAVATSAEHNTPICVERKSKDLAHWIGTLPPPNL